MLRRILFVVVIFSLCIQAGAQTDSTTKFKTRKLILASGTSVFAIGSLIGLNQAWYSTYNTGSFHFFNDNKEWLQIDKLGHSYSTYQSGRLMIDAFKWAGFSKKSQLIYGGGIGYLYMSAIEVMDGFSRGWGYSWGDQLCNTIGTSAAVSQAALWDEQRIQFKFSYQKSGFAKYNPSLLGNSFSTQLLKDYNAQTYWLSFSPFTFTKKYPRIPRWINLSLGYSASGMIGGFENVKKVYDGDGNEITFERVRQFYLSFDLDLTKIKTKSKVLKSIFSCINILKIPAPTIEFQKNGLRLHALYY